MNRVRALSLAVLLSVFVASPAVAQRYGSAIVGLNGGAASSQLGGGGASSDFRWGGTAGLFATWRSTPYNVFSLEVNWIQKGGQDVARIDYIEIPFMVGGVASAGGGSTRFRFYTGLDFAIKISCSEEATLANCDNARGTEWSWPFGITIGRYSQDGKFFGVDARYLLGLSDTFEVCCATNRTWVFKAFFGISR